MSNKTDNTQNKSKFGLGRLFSSKKKDEEQDSLTLALQNRLDEVQEQVAEAEPSELPMPESTEEQPYQYTLEENLESAETTEALEVEKQAVTFDSEESTEQVSNADGGKTTVFDAAVRGDEASNDMDFEAEHEELDLSSLEDSAKSYFDATHADSIDDKIDQLCKLADTGFEELQEEADLEQPEMTVISEEQEKPKKKRKKKDFISNDDIEKLTESSAQKGKDDGDELMDIFGKSKEAAKHYAQMLEDEPEVEYTSELQETSIIKELRSKTVMGFVSIVLTLAVTILCGYFETSAGTAKIHPGVFEPGRYGAVYALSMLQLMFFGIIFNLDGVKRAFLSLNPQKARPEGLCALTVCICTLHTILSITLAANSPKLSSYCTVGCLSLLMLSINSFIKSYTALTSFCVAASKKPKYTTAELDNTSKEAAAFHNYLDSDTAIFTVNKASFVNSFFKKTYAAPHATKGSFKLGIIGVIVGVVCGIVSALITRNVYTAVTVGTCVMLACLPINLMLATALPFLINSVRAYSVKTAYIGEAACDAYTDAGIISFDDVEAFSPREVKVTSIRTYGDNRIDKVIVYMARIFDKLGGPLSFVFANSIQGGEETVGQAQIIEHFADGLRIKLDGKEILLGNSNFFRLFDIATPADNIDESFLQSLGSIMYMSVDGGLAAKFYIKYSMSKMFESVVHSMYAEGVCVGVRSYDPCINSQLIKGNLKCPEDYPISVIKPTFDESAAAVSESTDSSVVSLSGLHNLLYGWSGLDKMRDVYRSNAVFGTACAILSLVITAVITLTGAVDTLSSSYFIVLQLLWCLPTVAFSVFAKPLLSPVRLKVNHDK